MVSLSDSTTRATREIRQAWRPRRRLERSAWCGENIRLPSKVSAAPGKYDLTDRPYFAEILDAVDDPGLREIVLLGGAQIGKTTLLHSIIASQGETDAAPMMFAGPDQTYIREERDKIYSLLEACPTLAPKIPPKRLRNDRAIDLTECLVYLAWSGSTQRLSGRSCKIVLCSECDRWQNEVSLASERTKAFWRSCVIWEGTPIGASDTLGPLYAGSDRRTWRCPCPHCGHYQELRMFPHSEGQYAGRGGIRGFRDEAGGWRTKPDARRHAHYECESCQQPITSEQKPEMIRRGRWVRDGQHLDKAGKLRGKPNTPGRRAGYHLPSILSPTVSFADLVEKYLDCRDSEERMGRFWNDWLALPFKPRGSTPRWQDLGRRLAGRTPRGLVPPSAWFLTAGADVQADRVYWIVRAWGDRATSWLVDWGQLRRPLGDEENRQGADLAGDLAQLDTKVYGRTFAVDGENPLGRSSLMVRILGVDCGHRPTDVYDFVRAHPGDRCRAIFGDPKITPGLLYRPAQTDRNARTGEVYNLGMRRWGVDTAAYKTDITDRWFADVAAPGAWLLPSAALAEKGAEDYLRQITNERRTYRKQFGRKLIRWEVIDAAIGEHYFDCEVYARCLADMVVGQNWDASTWPKPEPSRRPQPAAEPMDFSAR